MIDATEMTNEEFYRLNGTLTPARIERILDAEKQVESFEGLEAHVSEALAQLPAEDFLEPIKSRLHELSKCVRGANRTEVLAIIETLDDLAQCTFNASDYARSELNKLTAALSGKASS